MEENVFIYQTADDYYQAHINSQIASEPYAGTSAAASSPQRAARPGGGTGVIPNPTPLGDAVLPLLAILACYLILKARRKVTQHFAAKG